MAVTEQELRLFRKIVKEMCDDIRQQVDNLEQGLILASYPEKGSIKTEKT